MVLNLAVISIVTTLSAVYFALVSFRSNRVVQDLEGENADLRGRFAVLIAELRRLRAASGLSGDGLAQSPDDELMPLRRTGRGTTRNKPPRPTDGVDNVVLVSVESTEQRRLVESLSRAGYRTVSTSLTEVLQFTHELSTAALVLDLRDMPTAIGARAFMELLVADPLAKEVPVFALVASRSERERIIDEGPYTFAFVVPTDTAVFISTLGAAIIRRKTRSRRAETARNLSSALSRTESA